MKSVLISIRPQWCEQIASGKKTIEVRKSAPKEVPFKAYIYCSKGNANEIVLLKDYKNRFSFGDYRNADDKFYRVANGKVIGEFICDKVYNLVNAFGGIMFADENLNQLEPQLFRDMSCLTDEQTADYLGNKDGYGWHISDLKIYNKPKDLIEFWGRKNCLAADTVECWNCFAACREINGRHYQPLSRPPQSWQYVEELEK